jgi:hypothetical protein
MIIMTRTARRKKSHRMDRRLGNYLHQPGKS